MEVNSRNGKFPATLEAPRQDVTLRFSSAKDVEDFLGVEIAFHADLQGKARSTPAINTALTRLQKASAQVKRSGIDVANIDAPPGGPIEALKSLAAEGVLISSGPMGAALRDVSAIQISA
jgi:hypothetical protein